VVILLQNDKHWVNINLWLWDSYCRLQYVFYFLSEIDIAMAAAAADHGPTDQNQNVQLHKPKNIKRGRIE
jgi:hypothetical protein